MKLFLLVIAGILVSCAMAPALPACSTPPTLTITYSWPPSAQVGVVNSTVPSAAVSTALSNWNNGLLAYCNSPTLFNGAFGNSQINMSFGYLPPPSNCPSGSTCYTRGLTDLPNATFTSGRLQSVNITINSQMQDASAITEVVAHEFGHTFGLYDCNYPGCPTGSSVMEAGAPTTSINGIIGQPGPTPCDMSAVGSVATDYACQPSPPPPCPGNCSPALDSNDTTTPTDYCTYPNTGCAEGYYADGSCCAANLSPILIDTTGQGFDLTSAAGGVMFDITGTGHPLQMGWTASGAANAFLALPGADGLVHNGKQLFGDFTPQPVSKNPNGFAALAVYDDPKNGGNGDGIIDSRDAIFASLRLWIDANHDGIATLDELQTLPSLGVTSISLNYKADQRTDQFGNVFRYRAQVNPGDPANTGRMAYDVFFVTLHSPTTKNNPPSLIPNSLPSLMPVDAHKCVVPATKEGLLATGKR